VYAQPLYLSGVSIGDHSTGIFVFDGGGRLRLIGATNSPVTDFVHDIAALAAERPGRSR
jgi:hypothetical protein